VSHDTRSDDGASGPEPPWWIDHGSGQLRHPAGWRRSARTAARRRRLVDLRRTLTV